MAKIPAQDVEVRVIPIAPPRYAVNLTNRTTGKSTVVKEFGDKNEAEDHADTIREYWKAVILTQ